MWTAWREKQSSGVKGLEGSNMLGHSQTMGTCVSTAETIIAGAEGAEDEGDVASDRPLPRNICTSPGRHLTAKLGQRLGRRRVTSDPHTSRSFESMTGGPAAASAASRCISAFISPTRRCRWWRSSEPSIKRRLSSAASDAKRLLIERRREEWVSDHDRRWHTSVKREILTFPFGDSHKV